MFHVKRAAAISALPLILICASGCSAYNQDHAHNSGVGKYVDSGNEIIEFPFLFDNVARSCVDGDGVYVGAHGTRPVVVANDPACQP